MTLHALAQLVTGDDPALGHVALLSVTAAGLVWVRTEVRQLRADVRALREAWAAFTGKPLNGK